MSSQISCLKCGVALEMKKTVFDYMGRSFSEELPCCPVCGKVFVTPELAEGRMAEAEQMLEDK